MRDRVPTKPNRYAVYDDAHNFLRYEYHERADEPTQAGDALNKANLLPDTVATALGLTGNPQVKDALQTIGENFVDSRKYWWERYDISDGAVISDTVQNVTMSTGAFVTYQYSSNVAVSNGAVVLVNPQTSGSFNTGSNYGISTFNNAYFEVGNNVYYGTSDGMVRGSSTMLYKAAYLVTVGQIKGSFAGNVFSYTSTAYPSDGAQGGYYYIGIGQSPLAGTRTEIGSYTGTGLFGDANRNSLTFSFNPKLVIIYSPLPSGSGGGDAAPLIMIRGINGVTPFTEGSWYGSTTLWSNHAVAWYGGTVTRQKNADNVKYYYIAIGQGE